MRFLPHEHTAVTAALQARGIDPASVLFVKRRGRLHVDLPGRTASFIFFRKKSTALDAEGRWKDRTEYFIGEASLKAPPCTWEEVLATFNAWLGSTDR